ncbi:hypothetical protein BURMUCGD2M_6318 [Burkholderia multivorans CGD2M]|uniref:Uncharacterized protein n=1 Tax=Burkholderia multivorans CGD2 TaxID=513052 RepID=B9BNR1_9BURK|nr:hypothetical protein BURMUCGD2_6331 [Burkholderia multivorans CGD2]EEE13598.1 hypothetical protein BURMUCGD2M_6318 [Burkholderia multivorans CGD2M]
MIRADPPVKRLRRTAFATGSTAEHGLVPRFRKKLRRSNTRRDGA